MSNLLSLRLLFALVVLPPPHLLADTNPGAVALNQGRADDAAALLRMQLSNSPRDSVAHQLLCRVFYSVELADQAITECESAVANAHGNDQLASEDLMWLGRAYGMKASRANPISAFRVARKVVAAFERAVALDPRNVAALSDLGEYYVGAPSIVGGGLDKAQRLVDTTMPVSATTAHRLRALIAEKRGDFATAEAEFHRAVDALRSPASLVDLADFYQRRKRCDQSVTAVQAVVRLDRTRDSALVDAASVLIACNRDPQQARDLLNSYLNSSARSDAAPAARVRVQLGDLLAKMGDIPGAKREYEAAIALSSNYAPARKALQTR